MSLWRKHFNKKSIQRGTVVALSAVCTTVVAAGLTPAIAAPAHAASIERVVTEGPTQDAVYVYSPAMDKTVKVQVLHPRTADGPRPTLYMLGGLGEEDPENSIWLIKTDAVKFFADKNVTVAFPMAGNGSFYTDWQRDDPKLGRYRYETFLTKELPPLLEARYNGSGRRGVAGLSMGAGAAMVLAARSNGFYNSAASFSGCYTTSGLAGQTYPRGIVSAFGGNADNMWGPVTDPAWQAHDVLNLTEGLRGSTVYVSTGTGKPGLYDSAGYPGNDNPIDRQVVGGGIEAATYLCTLALDQRLRAARIPATIRYVDPGTHSWPYWVDQLHQSWPVVARGLYG